MFNPFFRRRYVVRRRRRGNDSTVIVVSVLVFAIFLMVCFVPVWAVLLLIALCSAALIIICKRC